MIGIIDREISAYSVIEKIHHQFPSVNIYLYPTDDLEEGIETLRKKNCQIIILRDSKYLPELEKKYPELTFLPEDKESIEDSFLLDDKDLLQAIEKGQEQEVRKILEELEIKEDTIFLKNPKLLFIKKIIKQIYPEKNMMDSIDILIEQIRNSGKIKDTNEEAKIQIIVEEK